MTEVWRDHFRMFLRLSSFTRLSFLPSIHLDAFAVHRHSAPSGQTQRFYVFSKWINEWRLEQWSPARVAFHIRALCSGAAFQRPALHRFSLWGAHKCVCKKIFLRGGCLLFLATLWPVTFGTKSLSPKSDRCFKFWVWVYAKAGK